MNGLASRTQPYLLAFFSGFCIMILELVAGRLVMRHVGASLTVWTSVIGIMLGGICLGNVLGGRLADRVEPARAVGPLYALGAFLTLACLWVNAGLEFTPGLSALPETARTLVVIAVDFLIPTTVLGMIGPVVAKMAVERARKSGSAIGDIYFFGAVGSIAGTFLAGFVLMYVAPVSAIVTAVAASLAVLGALLLGDTAGLALGLTAALFLGFGSVPALSGALPVPVVRLGSTTVNALLLIGYLLTAALAAVAVNALNRARAASAPDPSAAGEVAGEAPRKVGLGDLAALSFLASLSFMALEMVAGRLVTRHLGSSIYGWTSVIGVLLGGLSLGNFLGGKLADRFKTGRQASWLFLLASVLTMVVLLLEIAPNPKTPVLGGLVSRLEGKPLLSHAISLTSVTLPGGFKFALSWPWRVLAVVAGVFFLPSVAMGTFSPVVANLAVERLRSSKRTGAAIGQVYAWGMVGSIVGTFLTGFVLIDLLGTKGVLILLATVLGFAATSLGTVAHAGWAGLPLGLCLFAFIPLPWFQARAQQWGIREEAYDPSTDKDAKAWIDESNYYYIKVDNEPDAEGKKRTLVLDNLIHGYFVIGHPERLDYDYEHVYALVARRVAAAKAKAEGKADAKGATLATLFLGGGAYTFQRYMQHEYPATAVDVAEIDPAVTRANHAALGLPDDTTIKTYWGDARQFVERNRGRKRYDLVFGDAFNDFSVPWHLTTREFNDKLARMLSPSGVYMINIIDAYESDAKAEENALKAIKSGDVATDAGKAAARREALRQAKRSGGFLASWVRTARGTFPYIYVFGTDDAPGSGLRETFVVVASKTELDLDDLGGRDDDPKFFQADRLFEPRPFPAKHLDAINTRAAGVILTDDYAPVENLLAPVAETRGDDD